MTHGNQLAQLGECSHIRMEEHGPHLERRSNARRGEVGDEGIQRRNKQQDMLAPEWPVEGVCGIRGRLGMANSATWRRLDGVEVGFAVIWGVSASLQVSIFFEVCGFKGFAVRSGYHQALHAFTHRG